MHFFYVLQLSKYSEVGNCRIVIKVANENRKKVFFALFTLLCISVAPCNTKKALFGGIRFIVENLGLVE